MPEYKPFVTTRRNLLRAASAGFGHLALTGLLGSVAQKASAAELNALNPLAPKRPPLPVKAKRVIFLFMEGAMSSVDTFEYKPELGKRSGKSGPGGGTITPSRFKFSQYGNSGSWFSELLPNIATHADELCWLRGLYTDTAAHPQAVVQLHTGSANASLTRPSWGSWLLYGLGTENQDLPVISRSIHPSLSVARRIMGAPSCPPTTREPPSPIRAICRISRRPRHASSSANRQT